MIKRLEMPKITEEVRRDYELAEWAFQSHSWVETDAGYFYCEWCSEHVTVTMPISKDYPLCEENPCIKKLLEEVSRERE